MASLSVAEPRLSPGSPRRRACACARRWGAGGGCPPRPCRRRASSPKRAHTRRRRHAVLAGAGLGDDAPLAEAPGEQRLPERVVDLVRAGVGEVLALEPDLRAADVLGQPLGEVERRRAAAVVAPSAARARRGRRGRRARPRPRPRARRAPPSPSRARSARRSAEAPERVGPVRPPSGGVSMVVMLASLAAAQNARSRS